MEGNINPIWMASIIALWVLVLFETVLLVLLLRALGEIRQRGGFATPVSNAHANEGLPLGTQAPAFSAKTPEGNAFNLAETDGKWRVLTFISPGCSACESALKTLQDFQQEKQDIDVLVVAGTDFKENQAYATEKETSLPLLTPTSKAGKEAFQVQGVPFAFILDKNGIILAKSVLNARDHLQELLKEANAPVRVFQ
jgi:methylamine dehydrogenase accessory protein MauD